MLASLPIGHLVSARAPMFERTNGWPTPLANPVESTLPWSSRKHIHGIGLAQTRMHGRGSSDAPCTQVPIEPTPSTSTVPRRYSESARDCSTVFRRPSMSALSCERSRRHQPTSLVSSSKTSGPSIIPSKRCLKPPSPKQASGSPSPSSSRLTHEKASKLRLCRSKPGRAHEVTARQRRNGKRRTPRSLGRSPGTFPQRVWKSAAPEGGQVLEDEGGGWSAVRRGGLKGEMKILA